MLHFDLEWRELWQAGEELGATEKQVQFAVSRALRRTEASLRKLSMRGLPKVLALRNTVALRNRLKGIRMRKARSNGKANFSDSAGIWYGLNDMPVGVFKGSPKKTKDGASFRDNDFKGGFIGKSKFSGRKSIFKRSEKNRLPVEEQLYPIEDAAIVFIEDEVFGEALDIFWGHFRRDLAARVKYNLGGS